MSAAWDWRPTPSLNLVTHLYHSRISRLVVTQPSGNVGAIPGAVLINPETKGNAGRQQQSGLDLSAQWRFRLGGDWTGDLWGSASWIHGRIDEGNGVDWAIPYAASHKFKLGATLRWLDRVSITPKVYWTGAVTNGRKKAPGDPLLPLGAGASTASLLADAARQAAGNELLFRAVHHVTAALDSIQPAPQRQRFRELSLLAARRAKRSGDYPSALGYIQTARALGNAGTVSDFARPPRARISCSRSSVTASPT